MPERKDSVDSFDDFFGVAKTDNERKKSPIKPKENEKITHKRPQTPSTPETRRVSSPKSKSKISSSKTNGYRQPSPDIVKRAESVQSKQYESDFDDDDNAFDDDKKTRETPHDKKKHASLPPPKQRTAATVLRRGSDSEVKKSYVIPRPTKPKEEITPRKEPILPYIKPHQTRPINYPVRRQKENLPSSAKTEAEQRELSARNNKLRSLEARIAELRRELEEQRIENSTLRTIQRREEKAIKKYEEKEYDIHRIVRDYTNEIDHVKEMLIMERDKKQRLEKQIEVREEKLRDQQERLKKFEQIVQEKHLDERYELKEKLVETDKKLQSLQEKLAQQERHIEVLEKNHRHEVNQELSKQRDLKKQLEARIQKYNDLSVKLEDKTRQIDTMHIYAQRAPKRTPDSPSNLTKTRSLQSFHDGSPRAKDRSNDQEKKRREQERKTRAREQEAAAKKNPPKKETQHTTTTNKHNDQLPPKAKPARRLSTPKSVDEQSSIIEDETIKSSKIGQRNDPHLSRAQIHKRQGGPDPLTNGSKSNPSEPPAATKPRPTRDLDEKWSDLFGSNKDEAAKDDLLAKLVADEQQERRLATNNQRPGGQHPSMNMFESSTTKPTTTTTTVKPVDDPFESLFSNNNNNNNNSTKPKASRTDDFDDFFSTKPSNPPSTTTVKPVDDPFESLFGSSTTTNNTTTTNSKPYSFQSDKLQRPKVVQNGGKPIPNRTIVDEVEEFVM